MATQKAAAIASIDLLDPGPPTSDLAEYLHFASRVWELRRTGRQAEAIYIVDVRLIPAFDLVQQDLDAARVFLDERAESAQLWREIG